MNGNLDLARLKMPTRHVRKAFHGAGRELFSISHRPAAWFSGDMF
jgi:hypothetical protein